MDLMAKAHEIARSLGEGWTARKQEEMANPDLYGPNREVLWLNSDSGRIAVHPGFGEHDELAKFLPYDRKLRPITVSKERPSEAIAREISRRLLPEYRELLAFCRDRQAEHDRDEQAQDKVIAQLHAILGTFPSRYAPRTAFVHAKGGPNGTFEVRSGEVKIELHVSYELALEWAERLKGLLA